MMKSENCIFFFKQKTAYEIGTGDWSSDVCSSDLNCVIYELCAVPFFTKAYVLKKLYFLARPTIHFISTLFL